MQFYLATDPEGKRQLLTRADEAAKIDPAYKQLEIGTDKASLQQALQELLTEADNAKATLTAKETESVPVAAQKPSIPLSATQKDVVYPEKRWTTDQIIDFLFDEAEVHQVGQIMEVLGSRISELIKETQK